MRGDGKIWPALAAGAALAASLAGGCLGGPADSGDAASMPASAAAFGLVSAFGDETGFYWQGVTEGILGLTNPDLVLLPGETMRITIRHGDGAADQADHNVRILQGGETLADSPVVSKAGDEAVLEWTPPAPGVYAYACKFHSFSQAGRILVGVEANLTPPPPPAPEPPPAPVEPPKPVSYALETHLDLLAQDPGRLPDLTRHWRGAAGDIAGQDNPTLAASVGAPVEITLHHHGDAGDIDAHAIAIFDGRQAVATSGEVTPGGPDATLVWTPTKPGAYTYGCPHHAGMEGALTVGVTVLGVESHYDATTGFQWRGSAGAEEGKANPALSLAAGATLQVRYRHGDSVGDDQMHNLRLKDPAGKTVADGNDVATPGEEASVEWVLSEAGAWTYECKYHADTQRGTIQVSG